MAGLPVAGYGRRLTPGSNNQLLQTLLTLLGQENAGYEEARQANETRYQDILEMFGANRERTMNALADFGQSLVDDTNRNYDDKRNELLTDLADRGLSGSTKRIGVEMATQRERDAAVNRIKDMLTENRTQADLGFTDRATGVMERRSDPYPEANMNSSALLAQVAGLLAGGGGGVLGGLTGGLGGSGNAVRAATPYYHGRAATPQGTPYINDFRGMQQDSAEQDRTRRTDMLRLYTATRKGGVEGADAENAALQHAIVNGTGEFNPGMVGRAVLSQMPPAQYSTQYSPAEYYPAEYDPMAQQTRIHALQGARNARAAQLRDVAAKAMARRKAQQAAFSTIANLSILPTPWTGRVTGTTATFPADQFASLFGG